MRALGRGMTRTPRPGGHILIVAPASEDENGVEQAADALIAADSLILCDHTGGHQESDSLLDVGLLPHRYRGSGSHPSGVFRPADQARAAGPAIDPSGDVHRDMDVIREFYAGKQGIRPDNAGVVRLREED